MNSCFRLPGAIADVGLQACGSEPALLQATLKLCFAELQGLQSLGSSDDDRLILDISNSLARLTPGYERVSLNLVHISYRALIEAPVLDWGLNTREKTSLAVIERMVSKRDLAETVNATALDLPELLGNRRDVGSFIAAIIDCFAGLDRAHPHCQQDPLPREWTQLRSRVS